VSEIYQLPLEEESVDLNMQFGMGPASGYDIRWLTRVDDATSTTYTYGYVCIMGKIPCYGNRLSRGCLGKGHEGRQDMRAWLSIDDPGAARYRSPLNERIPKKKEEPLFWSKLYPGHDGLRLGR